MRAKEGLGKPPPTKHHPLLLPGASISFNQSQNVTFFRQKQGLRSQEQVVLNLLLKGKLLLGRRQGRHQKASLEASLEEGDAQGSHQPINCSLWWKGSQVSWARVFRLSSASNQLPSHSGLVFSSPQKSVSSSMLRTWACYEGPVIGRESWGLSCLPSLASCWAHSPEAPPGQTY